MNGRLKAAVILAAIIGVAYYAGDDSQSSATRVAAEAETYRLVHAIGNEETIVAKGLTKRECEIRKKDNIAVAEALGIHSERLGIGSITCLPESLFSD